MADKTAIYGAVTDIYTAIPTNSGMALGDYYRAPDGKRYRFCQASATFANQKAGVVTAGDSTVVKPSDAASQFVCGSNQTGSSVAANSYFWLQTEGNMTVLMVAGVSTGNMLISTATSGSLDKAGAGAVTNSFALADSPGGGGATACRMSAGL